MNDNYILITEYSPQEMIPAGLGLGLGLGLIPTSFNAFIGGRCLWDEATCTPRLNAKSTKLGPFIFFYYNSLPIILEQFSILFATYYSQNYASIIHQGLLTIMENR